MIEPAHSGLVVAFAVVLVGVILAMDSGLVFRLRIEVAASLSFGLVALIFR